MLWKEAQTLDDSGTPFVMVTLISLRGSAPQDPGAKMLVTKEGLYAGTVGGGKIEMTSLHKSKVILERASQSQPEIITWNLQKDIGMSCGGEVTMLFEHFNPVKWPIAIFGAGHVAQALVETLKRLRCSITCIDPREEWISKMNGIKTICHPHPKDIVPTLDPRTFFVVMTMGHDHDMPILLEIARHQSHCPYVGVIGSKIKGIKIKNQLEEAQVDPRFIEKLRVPMGLTLGSNDPFEIAISIAGELIQVRDQGIVDL